MVLLFFVFWPRRCGIEYGSRIRTIAIMKRTLVFGVLATEERGRGHFHRILLAPQQKGLPPDPLPVWLPTVECALLISHT